MPTIKARKQVDGSHRYTAIVRIRRQGKVLHQEAKTFAHRSAAERWGKHREVALEDPSALVRVQQPSTKLSKLIRWYMDNFQHISKWQRSKQSQLLYMSARSSPRSAQLVALVFDGFADRRTHLTLQYHQVPLIPATQRSSSCQL